MFFCSTGISTPVIFRRSLTQRRRCRNLHMCGISKVCSTCTLTTLTSSIRLNGSESSTATSLKRQTDRLVTGVDEMRLSIDCKGQAATFLLVLTSWTYQLPCQINASQFQSLIAVIFITSSMHLHAAWLATLWVQVCLGSWSRIPKLSITFCSGTPNEAKGGLLTVIPWGLALQDFLTVVGTMMEDFLQASSPYCRATMVVLNMLVMHTAIVADKPFLGGSLMEGLVIDDYFAVAVSDRFEKEAVTEDVRCFNEANKAYVQEKILGSPAKDIVGERCAKVVGAQINSSETALSRGLCTIGAPPAKRYALSWITLMVCQLAYTTDVLHVCLLGAWVSVLMYRRPLMSLLNKSFKLVDACCVDASCPKLVPLTRQVACELTLLAILVPFAVSDLAAEFCSEVFCTDVSLQKGAICSSDIDSRSARMLWSGLRSKGAFHRLLTPSEALAKRLGLHEELPDPLELPVGRPLAFHYDFIQVFAGAAAVTSAMASLGFSTGPPIDLDRSCEFNMERPHVMAWLSFMVCSRRVKSFMVSPPCTTFSIMRRPALRSKHAPFGFDSTCNQTRNGNLLAHRGLQLMQVGYQNEVPGIFETPWSALLKHLPSFQSFLGKPEVQCKRCDSCMFGSEHLKSFRFLGVHVDLDLVNLLCDKSHQHVVIQGTFTKASATYVPLLARALAECLSLAISKMKEKIADLDEGKFRGHESQMVNSIALTCPWKVVSAWKFRRQSHINILEMTSLGRLATRLASRGSATRVTALLDSFVCSAAASKGRTSSLGLAASLRRFASTCVASALYFCSPFVPTRLNASDDPTRDVPTRQASSSFVISDWSDEDLSRLLSLPKLRRWISNWVRLTLSLCGPSLLYLSDRSLYRQTFRSSLSHVDLSDDPFAQLSFDSTLGFPGEGPGPWFFRSGLRSLVEVCLVSCVCCCCLPLSLFLLLPRPPSSSVGVGCSLLAMVLQANVASGGFVPRNAADRGRAALRSSRPALVAGRPVLPATTLHRESLFSAFLDWCRNLGIDFELLLEHAMQNLDEINSIVCRFGRELYSSGGPYGHYAETINSIAARRPAIRRHLQQCWDYAFAWVKAEPPVHHIAMPFQALLACLTTALMWGWTKFAGVLALTWGSILRIGETLKARRRDLLLPCDMGYTHDYSLLAIDEAKTCFSAARHQTAKLDIPDLLRVVSLAFSSLSSECFLWPYSGSTLRTRFRMVLQAVQLPTKLANSLRPLDLGSLRAGGATWMLSISEDGEMVRRRGRWLSQRIMEIYIQETSAIRLIQSLSPDQRATLLHLASTFLNTLHLVEIFQEASIPSSSWYILCCRQWCAFENNGDKWVMLPSSVSSLTTSGCQRCEDQTQSYGEKGRIWVLDFSKNDFVTVDSQALPLPQTTQHTAAAGHAAIFSVFIDNFWMPALWRPNAKLWWKRAHLSSYIVFVRFIEKT